MPSAAVSTFLFGLKIVDKGEAFVAVGHQGCERGFFAACVAGVFVSNAACGIAEPKAGEFIDRVDNKGQQAAEHR